MRRVSHRQYVYTCSLCETYSAWKPNIPGYTSINLAMLVYGPDISKYCISSISSHPRIDLTLHMRAVLSKINPTLE